MASELAFTPPRKGQPCFYLPEEKPAAVSTPSEEGKNSSAGYENGLVGRLSLEKNTVFISQYIVCNHSLSLTKNNNKKLPQNDEPGRVLARS